MSVFAVRAAPPRAAATHGLSAGRPRHPRAPAATPPRVRSEMVIVRRDSRANVIRCVASRERRVAASGASRVVWHPGDNPLRSRQSTVSYVSSAVRVACAAGSRACGSCCRTTTMLRMPLGCGGVGEAFAKRLSKAVWVAEAGWKAAEGCGRLRGAAGGCERLTWRSQQRARPGCPAAGPADCPAPFAVASAAASPPGLGGGGGGLSSTQSAPTVHAHTRPPAGTLQSSRRPRRGA